MSVGIAILAGGGSSRMGKAKQLLPFGRSTLIEHVISAATESICSPVVLVLGSHADDIQKEIMIPHSVHVAVNEHWQEGLSSSLRMGILAVCDLDAQADAIVTVLCDQPFVNATVINQLVETFDQSGKLIVASRYAGAFGPPALFHRSLFDELLQISGDQGAKVVVERHASEATSIEFPDGKVDVDTLEDYSRLQSSGQV